MLHGWMYYQIRFLRTWFQIMTSHYIWLSADAPAITTATRSHDMQHSAWVNALFGRFVWNILHDKKWENRIRERIVKLVPGVSIPAFYSNFRLVLLAFTLGLDLVGCFLASNITIRRKIRSFCHARCNLYIVMGDARLNFLTRVLRIRTQSFVLCLYLALTLRRWRL